MQHWWVLKFSEQRQCEIDVCRTKLSSRVTGRIYGCWRWLYITMLLVQHSGCYGLLLPCATALQDSARAHNSNRPVMFWQRNNQVYTNRDEAFDKNFVDGSKFDDDEEASEDAKKAERSKRLAAIHAHMEHEFDSVRRLLGLAIGHLEESSVDLNRVEASAMP